MLLLGSPLWGSSADGVLKLCVSIVWGSRGAVRGHRCLTSILVKILDIYKPSPSPYGSTSPIGRGLKLLIVHKLFTHSKTPEARDFDIDNFLALQYNEKAA